MSKQLALSSCFSIFAMACLVLLATPDQTQGQLGEAWVTLEAEMPSLDLPKPQFAP